MATASEGFLGALFWYEKAPSCYVMRTFSDGSVAVFHPFLGSLVALPLDGSLIVNWLSKAGVSESELFARFSEAYSENDPSLISTRFQELLCLLTEEYCVLRKRVF